MSVTETTKEEQAAEEREQKLQELRKQLTEVQQAEQRLIEEQAELEEKQKSALDSDDPALIEAALSGKSLSKGSSYRKAMDRLAELPGMIYAPRRRVLQLKIEISGHELGELEEERVQLGRAAHEAHERLLEAQQERDYAQSIAAGAASDRDEKRRSIARLEQQLAAHEQNKPSADRFDQELAKRRVWRWS